MIDGSRQRQSEVDLRASARLQSLQAGAEYDLGAFIELTSHVEGFRRPKHFAPALAALDESMRRPVYLLLEGPPRHGKSELVFHAIVRAMRYRPGIRIAYVTYSTEFAERKSRRIRKLAARAGLWVGAEKTKTEAFDPSRSVKFWETPGGGVFIAGGRGSGFEGEGFDLIVVDDPFKNPEEAESLTIRDNVWEFCAGTLFNRLEPGGSIVVTHKRWHVDDLIARIKAQREEHGDRARPWRVLSFQALSDAGAPLWPERYDAQALQFLRTDVGEYYWWAQFQQQPRPRGGAVFTDFARYEPPAKKLGRRVVIGVDPASTEGTSSDYSAIAILSYWVEGGLLHADIVRVIRVKREVPELVKLLRQVQAVYPGAPCVVETFGGDGRATLQQLRRIDPKLNVHGVQGGGDKFLRAQTMAAMASSSRLRVPAHEDEKRPWLKDFLAEARAFTGIGDKHDDQVDAVAHAVNYAAGGIGGKAKKGTRTRTLVQSPF